MEIEGDDDLELITEGPNVRALAGRVNILFPKSARDAIVQAYNEWRPRTLAHFLRRWLALGDVAFKEADLNAVVREVTLHWMAFHVMHRMPIKMGAEEWDQPMTRRIIRAAVERALTRDSEEANRLCAQLMGISLDDYQRWAKADDTFLGLM